jgi:hypothetical protein
LIGWKYNNDELIQTFIHFVAPHQRVALASPRKHHVLPTLPSKALNEFIAQKARNREYLEAQRGKEKVIEAQDEIRKRKKFEIS